MARNQGNQDQDQGNQNQGNQDEGFVGIERITRLNVKGALYETTSNEQGNRLTVEFNEDGNKEELSIEEAEALADFASRFARAERRNQEGGGNNAGDGQGQGSGPGGTLDDPDESNRRGRVKDPEHDGRLKGNRS